MFIHLLYWKVGRPYTPFILQEKQCHVGMTAGSYVQAWWLAARTGLCAGPSLSLQSLPSTHSWLGL